MIPKQLDPAWNWVMPHPVVRSLQQKLHDPDIMAYWHGQAGTFVVGTWFNKRLGLVCEHIAVSRERFTRPDALREIIESVMCSRSRRSYDDLAAIRQDITDAEDTAVRDYQDEADLHTDVVDFLRKKGRFGDPDDPFWLTL